MRKLASVQKIKALHPIAGADSIETASVLGWQVVVKKNEFKVGDLVVYCEIDSLLPDKPEFDFLKSSGMRIRTVRMRGQISQGICFPLSVLPLGFYAREGDDCTEILGVEKYEPQLPESLKGIAKGGFPSFIPKTDETRVQVLQELLTKFKGTNCYITEKLDGSSATFYMRNGVFGICSRNLEFDLSSDNDYTRVAQELDIEGKLKKTGKNIALQGELIGEGVQGNKYKIKGKTVRFFNVFDIDKYEYLNFSDFVVFVKNLGFETVPIADENYSLCEAIGMLIEKSVRKSILNPAIWAEGIVIRPKNEIKGVILSQQNMHLDRLSFKVINPEFSLKFGE